MDIDYNALNKISYGMYIITTKENGKYVGCVANVLGQITSDPIMLSICLNKNNYTNECLRSSKKVAISILSQNTPPLTIGTFGYRSSRDVNKFENIDYSVIDELPIINNSIAYLIGEIIEEIEVETHTLFIVKLKNSKMLSDEIPMTYDYYRSVIKGKSPKNAPTFQKTE